jgi:hypothetical protein
MMNHSYNSNFENIALDRASRRSTQIRDLASARQIVKLIIDLAQSEP